MTEMILAMSVCDVLSNRSRSWRSIVGISEEAELTRESSSRRLVRVNLADMQFSGQRGVFCSMRSHEQFNVGDMN